MATVSEAVRAAMLAELARRRPVIDAGGLVSVCVEVKLQAGPEPVRAVLYSDQRIVASRPGARGREAS